MTDPTRQLHATHSLVTPQARRRAYGHHGATVWLTGLSGAGKSTLAYATEAALIAHGAVCYVLDGDNIRHGLNRDLGFSPTDRTENIRRIGEVCRLFCDAGTIVLAAFISPYRHDRDQVRALHPAGRFIEVHMAAPLEICEQRDPKGLYAKARAGTLDQLTGVNAPYEPPLQAELSIDTSTTTTATGVKALIETLRTRSILT